MIDVVTIGKLLIDFTCQYLDEFSFPTMAAHPGGECTGKLSCCAIKVWYKNSVDSKGRRRFFGRLMVKTVKRAEIDTRVKDGCFL